MFDLVLPVILETVIHPVTNLIVDAAGDTDSTRARQRFNAGRYIDAFAVDIFAIIDDIAKIDTHAELQFTRHQALLHGYRAIYGIQNG